MTLTLDQLQPGDVLLYRGWWIVRHVTNSDVGHAAVYIGNGQVATADTPHGVNTYPADKLDEVVYVLRPLAPFDLQAALKWFATVIGRPYGWSDDFADINLALDAPVDNDATMNCSHTSAHLLAAGACPVVATGFDLREVTPRDLRLLPGLNEVYRISEAETRV